MYMLQIGWFFVWEPYRPSTIVLAYKCKKSPSGARALRDKIIDTIYGKIFTPASGRPFRSLPLAHGADVMNFGSPAPWPRAFGAPFSLSFECWGSLRMAKYCVGNAIVGGVPEWNRTLNRILGAQMQLDWEKFGEIRRNSINVGESR